MLELFAMPFMIRAVIAGILVAFLGSSLGTFVVQRKMSFLGDGLAHAAFGGVALGLLLGTEPLWVAVPFTLIVSLAITLMKEHTNIEQDTSIGIFFAVSVALGVVFLSIKDNYSADAYSYLFGSILSVSMVDLYISIAMVIVTILSMIKYWHRWAYATFDTELARADGLRTKRDDLVLSALISMVIVLSIKLVGIVLIASFLVIPAATAKLVSRTFSQMTILSIVFGVIGAIIGLFLSVIFDLPSGAVIILVQASLFVIIAVFVKVMK